MRTSLVSAKIRILLLICLLVDVSIRFSFAFRPFRTEDAGTNLPGVLGLELGNEFTSTSDGKENKDTISLTYGLIDWIEADVDIVFRTLILNSGDNEFGFGDTVLSGKFRLIDEREILPALLLKPSISFPIGDKNKGLGSGEIEPGILLVLEKTFWKLTGKTNLGYFVTNLGGDYKDKIFYAFELDFPVFERLRLASEVTGGTNSRGENGAVFTLTGLLFEITKAVVLDGAVEFGLNEAASGFTLILGVSFSFLGEK